GDAIGHQRFAAEAQRHETSLQDVLAAGIERSLRATRNQFAREVERRRGVQRSHYGDEGSSSYCARFKNAGSISSLVKSPATRAAVASVEGTASTREDGALWLTSHARLVGESDAASASSYVSTPSRYIRHSACSI